MLKYVFKRILAMIPVLFIISIVIFGTVKAMPGDEVTAYFGAGSKVTQEQRDHVRELLGLDKSLPEQYVRWVGRMCTGDLGSSITLKKPVGTIIGDYVWNTFYLNVVSLIVALIVRNKCSNILLCLSINFLRWFADSRYAYQRNA